MASTHDGPNARVGYYADRPNAVQKADCFRNSTRRAAPGAGVAPSTASSDASPAMKRVSSARRFGVAN